MKKISLFCIILFGIMFTNLNAQYIKNAEEVLISSKDIKTFLKKGEDTGTVDGDWFVQNYSSFSKKITIVDVRSSNEYKAGHIKNSINISIEEIKAEEFLNALPKNGEIVFYCETGTRAMEAWTILAQELKYNDIHRIFYLDANIKCNEKSECTIEPNEPLGV